MRYTLNGNHESGNCYKVALFFALSGIAYDWKQVDIFAAKYGGHRLQTHPEYLRWRARQENRNPLAPL